ncbi:hypothetical protein EMIHUDRAFT_101020 [Emiliania huxleyi CCMP1516]|uniref:arabinogalactan endo-beta-1,4-galactanase n=2 Tax=Emiliania huxleyi TaxID=2903 RepID=A0A0D3JM71_EMIH1|nr:hypothetical protein EMIHUDRAFT_101020 [Emiliania huxleyi CCMP1516]EOD24606.1 hypothetical protein EMIHUDRAFT_101020 [Emiliania huxleyi CCMP1516]|eukprot:XP_005777035.1 hypothetical protein EMIHUDRAFT_101020 [Emiliania huxleyi CCMP1516]
MTKSLPPRQPSPLCKLPAWCGVDMSELATADADGADSPFRDSPHGAKARRVAEANLSFILDLHYSDWWADPLHQAKPLAWQERATHPPLVVVIPSLLPATEVGNEITFGMLWERPGEACARGGRLACAGDLFGSKVDLAAWRRLGALVDAGMRGIAIHTSLGNRIAEFSSVGIGDWYELLLNHTTSPSFDRIGA